MIILICQNQNCGYSKLYPSGTELTDEDYSCPECYDLMLPFTESNYDPDLGTEES